MLILLQLGVKAYFILISRLFGIVMFPVSSKTLHHGRGSKPKQFCVHKAAWRPNSRVHSQQRRSKCSPYGGSLHISSEFEKQILNALWAPRKDNFKSMTLDCILQMGYIKRELRSACPAVHREERKSRVSLSRQGLQKDKGVVQSCC